VAIWSSRASANAAAARSPDWWSVPDGWASIAHVYRVQVPPRNKHCAALGRCRVSDRRLVRAVNHDTVPQLFFWVLVSTFSSLMAGVGGVLFARTHRIGWLLALSALAMAVLGVRACDLV
jgi:hypothetical protein